MASFRAVSGALTALRTHLDRRLADDPLRDDDIADVVENAGVLVLGSQDLHEEPVGNQIGIYLHRIAVDPYGRNRYLQPTRPDQAPRPELPVNLHVLIIGWSQAAAAEVNLVAWAMQELGSSLELDVSHLGLADARFGDQDRLQIIPEAMSTEDLMRVWDSLPGEYRLSSPYIIKTLRLEPGSPVTAGPAVTTLATAMEAR